MIVPMERVRIYGPRGLLDDTICLLYELGALQPEPLSSAITSRVSVPGRRVDDREAARERVELEALYEKVRRSLVLLPVPTAGGTTPARSFSAASLHDEETRRTVDDLIKRIESLSGRRKAAADRQVKVYRYRCCSCKRTFRDYPEGNTRADQTERLRLLAVLMWTFGLSHRASSWILSGLKVWVSHMTVWRDVQGAAQTTRKRNQWKPVRVLGLDGAYVLGWGEKQPVLVAVDMGTGEPLAVGYINECNPQAVRRWLEPLVQQHGVTVIVTDDLSSYKIVAEKLSNSVIRSVSSMFVAGWGKRSNNYRKPFPRSGCGSCRKFGNCWISYHSMAVKDSMPCGSSYRVVVRSLTSLVHPWNNCAISSYATNDISRFRRE